MKIFFSLILIFASYAFFGQNTLFFTDFNSGIPANVNTINADQFIPNSSLIEFSSNEAWISTIDPDSNANSIAASTSYFTAPDTANRWLILPQLTLGSFGNYLNWKSKSHDPSFPDDYLVLVSTSGNSISDFTDTIGNIEQENFEWTTREVNLSNLGYDDSTIYIAFVLRTYDGFKLYLDDILVESDNDVGLPYIDNSNVKIYPNPCKNIIKIDSQMNLQNISIHNALGELILETNQDSIDISNLSNGPYILRLKINNHIVNKHIIKY